VRREHDFGVISIVDDDESIRAATKALLRSVGYEVRTFASAELFLKSGALRETECLVLDIRMPGIDGLELQRRLNEAESLVPIIFVTAHDDATKRRAAIEAGAVDFFRKPFDANAFVAAVEAALRAKGTRTRTPAEVNANLTAARAAYRKAQAACFKAEEMAKDLPPGHPDGTQAFRSANQQVALASERYEKALREFVDFSRLSERSEGASTAREVD
jgi:FixJ family two-component response regulator